jgi:hypothetical protein
MEQLTARIAYLERLVSSQNTEYSVLSLLTLGAGAVDVGNPRSTFGKHQPGNAGLININSGFEPESATPEPLKLNEASLQKTYVAASLSEKGEQVKSNANHSAPMTAASIFGALVQI